MKKSILAISLLFAASVPTPISAMSGLFNSAMGALKSAAPKIFETGKTFISKQSGTIIDQVVGAVEKNLGSTAGGLAQKAGTFVKEQTGPALDIAWAKVQEL